MRKFLKTVVPLRGSKDKERSRTNKDRDDAFDADDSEEEFASHSNRVSKTLPTPATQPKPKPLRRYDTAPNLDPYTYANLPDLVSLRILELLPGEGEEEIRCRLHVTDWNHPMPYHAISYAWGDASFRVAIVCDGQRLDVTPNLAHCLYEVRRPKESRYIWADAVCINQKDLEERGHQVDNMRRIYRSAKKLLIWLGKDEAGYALKVNEAMMQLAKKCCEHRSTRLEDLNSIDNLWDTVAFPPYRVAMPIESWQAIEKLYLCSWFTRLWVFQEAVNSQQADVHWGSVRISWDIVGLTATYIQSWSHVIEYKYLHSGVYNCYTMRNRNNHVKFSVASILDWSRTFRCFDPLDRVYAMLGFPAFRRNGFFIQADYKRTPAELFIEVAHQSMISDKNLQILSYVDHTLKSHTRKPSWVPQWDPGSPGWTIGYKRTTWTWRATEGKEMKADINFELSTLNAAGVLLDVVDDYQTISNAKWYPHNPSKDHPVLQIWKDHFKKPWKYPSGERSIDVFGGVMVAGIPSNECNCCTRYEIVRKDFAAYMTRCAEEAGEDMNDEMWKEFYHKGARGDWKGYEQNGMNFCFGRAYFTMRSGWIGLGPNTLERGDLVVLLYGGDIPYVIRPRQEPDGGYVLIGEAYVHGVMGGEIMKKVDEGVYEEKIFEIY